MSISTIIKECIEDSPLSVRQIALESGTWVSNIYEFLNGKRDIHVKTADKLLRYFKLIIVDEKTGLKLEHLKRIKEINL